MLRAWWFFCWVYRFWYKRTLTVKITGHVCCFCTCFNKAACSNGTPSRQTDTCKENKNTLIYTLAHDSLWIIIEVCPFQHLRVSSEAHVTEVQQTTAAPCVTFFTDPDDGMEGREWAACPELLGSHWCIVIFCFKNRGTNRTLNAPCSNLNANSKAAYKYYHLFICCLELFELIFAQSA